MANYNLQLWSKEVATNLYETKNWYSFARNWAAYVNGNVCHIPQAAAMGSAKRIDGTSTPDAVVTKTFQDLTFNVYNVAATPRSINLDQDVANTFEGRTVLSEDMLAELAQAVSMEIAQGWQPTASESILRTSGAATRTNLYGKAACKSLTYADVLAARTKLSRDKVDMANLYMIVDSVMYADLLKMDEFTNANELGSKTVITGFVGEIAGIKVIERPLGIAYTATLAKPTLEYDDSYDNTHFSAALIVDGSKVGYAYGATQVGINEFATGYYTDILQARTRIGASPLYVATANNVKGVVAIVEAV